MKAVTRCLALFAATLVVGACSGDPTADDAGANLTIRTTPSAIWMANDESVPVTTAELIVEAVDALGGTAPGTWTATASGPFTVAEDVTYGGTTAGQIGYRRRFVITPTSEGEGTITLTGTGAPAGGYVIPVRVAPDPVAFNVTISDLNPDIAEEITLTAPAGTRFTSTTTVGFVAGGGNTASNGLAAPVIVSMSADSTSMQVLPAPNAAGRVQITGVANISTPTLKVTAISADSVAVERLDNVAATFSADPVAENTVVTITMPAGTKLRPTSQVTTVGAPSAPSSTALAAIVIARAADSSSITVIPMPGFDRAVNISGLRDARVPSLSLTLPTAAALTTSLGATVDSITDLGADDATAGPVGTVTINLAVGARGGFWDRGTWSGTDWVGFGGAQQDIAVNLTNAGNYTVTMDWDGVAGAASDIDFVLFNSTLTGTIGGFGAATGAHPEVITANFPAGTFYITAGIFAGSQPRSLRITILRNS